MRKLIARITGWPLVSFTFGYDRILRFANKYEDGVWYVKIFDTEINISLEDSYRDFHPVMNCRKHGVPLFEDSE